MRRSPSGDGLGRRTIRRGDIYLASSRTEEGVRRSHPVLVVQNDVGNRYRELTVIAAIRARATPSPVPLEAVVEPNASNGLKARSAIRLDHLTTIPIRSLVQRLGKLDRVTMRYVDQAMRISLGLARI